MTIGQRIKRLRARKDLTQEDLARRIGVNRSTLANWEIDRTEPDAEMLGRLAEALGVSADEMLGRDIPAHLDADSPKTKRIYDIVSRAKDLPDDDLEDMDMFVDMMVERYKRRLEQHHAKGTQPNAKGDTGKGKV